MSRRIVSALLLLLTLGIFPPVQAEEFSPAAFLGVLRGTAQTQNATYAILEGKLEHLRGEKDPEEYPVYFAIRITPERTTMQLILDNKEGYFAGQSGSRGDKSLPSITPMQEKSAAGSLLEHVGVSPFDLSMGFLHYDLVKELERTRVGIVPCRVLLLQDPVGKMQVKVYAAEDQLFTLKAEYLDDSGKVKRTVEIDAFRRQNGLYYAQKLLFSGPGWLTRIVFDRADVGLDKPNSHKQYFRKLQQEKTL